MKKLFHNILLAVLLTAMMAGATACSPDTEPAQTPAATTPAVAASPATAAPEAPQDDELDMMNLTWYPSFDWFGGHSWADDNEGEKWIRDNKKVEIEFMSAGGAASQKLTTMLVDNSFPDLVSVERNQDLQRMIASGSFVAFDDYLAKYDTNLVKLLGNPLLDMFRAEDGKLYTFPCWAIGNDWENGNGGWRYNDKYYQALGAPSLENYDDLIAYLRMVKAQYPDVLPLMLGDNSGAFPSGFYNIYGGMRAGNNPGYFEKNLAVKDGKLVSFLEDPDAQEALLFLNQLYREKLIAQDLFTMSWDQVYEYMRNGKVSVYTGNCATGYDYDVDALLAEDPEMYYQPIIPLGKAGEDRANIYNNSYNRMGGSVTLISKDAEDPERIFQLLDWMFGNEGQLALVFGPPGNLYDLDNLTDKGWPVDMRPEYSDLMAAGGELPWSDVNLVGNTSFVDGFITYLAEKSDKPLNDTDNIHINYSWPHSVNATELSNLVPDFETPTGIIYTNIDQLYKQIVPEIIMAGSPEECQATIDKYIAELYEEGLQEVLDYQTAIWAQNKEILSK